MHLVLTDRLACPRCGPAFGLILLAEHVEERRVVEGHLGCPNCRERYPVRRGFGDVREPPRTPLPDEPAPEPRTDTERAAQLRTLLGAAGAGEYTLASGRAAAWAPALSAAMEDGAEVVAMDSATRAWAESPGVSRLATAPALPFVHQSMRGVLLHGGDLAPDTGGSGGPHPLLAEAARILAPGSRVVVLEPPPGIEASLRKAGLPEALASSTLAAAGR